MTMAVCCETGKLLATDMDFISQKTCVVKLRHKSSATCLSHLLKWSVNCYVDATNS